MGESPLPNGPQTEEGNALIHRLRAFTPTLLRLLPLLSFTISLIILYSLEPSSFEKTWKGRTYYLFFAWLLALEMMLNWEELRMVKVNKIKSVRTIALVVALFAPTMYVIVANFYGLNLEILNLARQYGSVWPWDVTVPLSVEYLVFTGIFVAIILLQYGLRGIKNFSIAACFLGIIGALYSLDNLYNWHFTPFQMFVPTTAMLASNVLNLMGYRTLWLGMVEGMPTFVAWDAQGRYSAPFSIGWPCSGVESLLIYSVTILLFLRKSAIPRSHKIIYFAIGAVATYFINILRIVTIFIISINRGDIFAFHDYYGQLYSITWIAAYPFIIIGSQALLMKLRSWRIAQKVALNPLE